MAKKNAKITSFFQPKTSHARPSSAAPTSSIEVKQTTPPASSAEEPFKPPQAPASSQSGREDPGASLNKERVIPSSDGEDSSDDDSELEDPSALLGLAPAKHPPGVKRITGDDLFADLPRTTKPKKHNYKFSLERLTADRSKAKALEEDIRRARALADGTFGNSSSGRNEINEEVVEEVMGNEGGGRLLAALSRNMAATAQPEQVETWEFFEHGKSVDSVTQTFPAEAVEDHCTFAIMKNTLARDDMFLSGFVLDMAMSDETLPDEVLLWTLDQVCQEPREDLASAYARVLQKSAPILERMLTLSKISALFELLSAKKEALDLDRQLKIVSSPIEKHSKLRCHNLRLLVQLLGTAVNVHNVPLISCLLIRVALDDRVARYSNILTALEDSLGQIMGRVSKDVWLEHSKSIAYNLMNTVHTSLFRKRILGILPTLSPRLHLFHRRLANAFVFEDISYMTCPFGNLVKLSRFTNELLNARQYHINKDTDYVNLQSALHVMDLAIDSGATAGVAPENDREVDALVDVVKRMFSKIVDTNAQNLRRTEAKDILERIQFRLAFSVRSRQKMALDITQSKLNFSKREN